MTTTAAPPRATDRVRRLGVLYGGMLRAELQAASNYRGQLLLGAFGWVVPIAFLALWRGAADDGAVEGITAGQFTTYFAAVLVTTSVQVSHLLVFEIAPLVHSGRLSALLLRPAHPLHELIAKGMAGKVYSLLPLFVVVPALVVFAGGAVSDDGGQWLLAVTVGLLGSVGCSFIAAMVGSIALWITASAGIRGLMLAAEWLLGGLVAPITLLPWIFPELLRHQPFWYAIGAPAEVASGISTLTPWLLLEALAWVLFLRLLFGIIWRRGLRRYEAVGT